MPFILNIDVDHGVRIDRNDIWLLRRLLDEGHAAIFEAPTGNEVVIRVGKPFKVGPGLTLGLMAPNAPNQARLVIDHYVPTFFLHPPRNSRKPPSGPAAEVL